jgi:hypothetical protein
MVDGFLETRELDITEVLHEVVHTAKKSLVFDREKHRPSLYEEVVACNMGVYKMALARTDGCYTLVTTIPEHLLIIVRVMNRAVLFFACFPREARATPRAPHLVTTALLEDALVTFRAFLGILLEQLDRLLVLHRTLVRAMLVETPVDVAVLADIVLAETALVTGRHATATVLVGTRHKKDRLGSAVVRTTRNAIGINLYRRGSMLPLVVERPFFLLEGSDAVSRVTLVVHGASTERFFADFLLERLDTGLDRDKRLEVTYGRLGSM